MSTTEFLYYGYLAGVVLTGAYYYATQDEHRRYVSRVLPLTIHENIWALAFLTIALTWPITAPLTVQRLISERRRK